MMPDDPVGQVRHDWDRFWLEHDRQAVPPAAAGDLDDLLWVALAIVGVLAFVTIVIWILS